jgi:glycosyltransferase involved in cell wall biosynthesis
MTKQLLHVVFGGQRGGCETNAQVLIACLPWVRHRVVVFGDGGPMCDDWKQSGASVEVLGRNATTIHGSARAIRRIIASGRPSAAIFWHGLVRLPQLIHVLNPLRIPMAVHGGNPAYSMSKKTDLKFRLMERIFPPQGPLPPYLCCSEYVAASFDSSAYLSRFPRAVIYNGVRAPTVSRHRPRDLAPVDTPVIGMVARLNSIKDHATLIRAMVHVRRKFPSASLELAGDGTLRNSLENLARQLGLSSSVRFLGEVADVYCHMTRWDLFAYATTEDEGLGNALAEAMSYGLPCVVTDVGPMREFAGDNNAVTLTRPSCPDSLGRECIQLLLDTDKRRHLAKQGNSFASMRFDSLTNALQYSRVLGLDSDDVAASQLDALHALRLA